LPNAVVDAKTVLKVPYLTLPLESVPTNRPLRAEAILKFNMQIVRQWALYGWLRKIEGRWNVW